MKKGQINYRIELTKESAEFGIRRIYKTEKGFKYFREALYHFNEEKWLKQHLGLPKHGKLIRITSDAGEEVIREF